MNPGKLLSVAAALAACVVVAACSSTGSSGTTRDASVDADSAAVDGATVDGEVTSCPPAPFGDEFIGRPCHDPGVGCQYASPMGFASDDSVICPAHVIGQCVTGGSVAGTFQLLKDTVDCCATSAADVTWCSQPITEGAPCNEPDNSECVLQDQSATCACDKPGPIWRCAPLDGGVSYCPCPYGSPTCNAGADAGPDAGPDADAGLDAGAG